MSDATPVVPHQAGEFYAWLWWQSEERDGVFDLGGDIGRVDLWVDERLAFRNPAETKVSAVLTGDNPSTTLEARAALAGGKVLQEIRIGVRRDEREFFFTLKGPAIELKQAKLPSLMSEGEEAAIYDRMFLYEELSFVLAGLLGLFSEARTSSQWEEDVAAIRAWVGGND